MVHAGESFASAVRRQIFEEFGLEVLPEAILETYEIHAANEQRIIPGIRFLCLTMAGEPRLNKKEHSRYKWLALPIEEQLDWIGGIKEVLDRVATSLPSIEPSASVKRKGPIGFQKPAQERAGLK